jgi:NAD(P)-dependent dehydrogenase (short-subunit alcohol dehydrogenase family)
MKLKGKVAVVTGAASGMGKAIAKLFAQEGASVIVTDLNLEGAEAVVSEITAKGGSATAIKSNVAIEADVNNVIETAVSKYGTVDIMVNNAGIMDNFSAAADVTDDLWEKVFAVNTTGTMRFIRKVIPIFLERKSGVIVNIASLGGLHGSRAGAAYTASKFAVVGLTRNVGYQYATSGIRCNAIAPGAVNTNIGHSIIAPSQFGMERAMTGMSLNPRAGEPEEIATAALFLASDDSRFVNGTVLVVDGGWSAY